MTNPSFPRPTIPRDSINPIGVETIVVPVKPPRLARMTHAPGRSTVSSIPRNAVHPRPHESLLASVVTPPQTTSARQVVRSAVISRLRIVAPLLVIIAAGLIAVRAGTAPGAPRRSIAPRQDGTVTTQPVAVEPSAGATKREQATTTTPLTLVDGKSPERQAVDAIARGAYAEAAALYERMAGERGPQAETDVLEDAARIARRKSRRER